MKSFKNLLGQRIKEIRKARNLTQQALADLIKIEAKYISRIETGSSSPSLETLEKIANSLDVEVKELFNTTHLQDRDELIDKIIQKLKVANTKEVKLLYQITNDILNSCTPSKH